VSDRSSFWRFRLSNSLRRLRAGLGLRGECVWPGAPTDLFRAHESVYAFAATWCAGGAVLDAGCGTGYGSALLAQAAGSVLGVDVDPRSIAYARRNYRGPRLRFAVADLQELAPEPDSLDLVVSSNVLEHLRDPGRFLANVTPALRERARMLLVTPPIIDEGSFAANEAIRYHVSNLYVEDWVGLFSGAGFDVRVFRHLHGPGIERLDFTSPLPSAARPEDFRFVEGTARDLYERPSLGGVYLLSRREEDRP
jgi:SAM-dependent methyltransferase